MERFTSVIGKVVDFFKGFNAIKAAVIIFMLTALMYQAGVMWQVSSEFLMLHNLVLAAMLTLLMLSIVGLVDVLAVGKQISIVRERRNGYSALIVGILILVMVPIWILEVARLKLIQDGTAVTASIMESSMSSVREGKNAVAGKIGDKQLLIDKRIARLDAAVAAEQSGAKRDDIESDLRKEGFTFAFTGKVGSSQGSREIASIALEEKKKAAVETAKLQEDLQRMDAIENSMANVSGNLTYESYENFVREANAAIESLRGLEAKYGVKTTASAKVDSLFVVGIKNFFTGFDNGSFIILLLSIVTTIVPALMLIAVNGLFEYQEMQKQAQENEMQREISRLTSNLEDLQGQFEELTVDANSKDFEIANLEKSISLATEISREERERLEGELREASGREEEFKARIAELEVALKAEADGCRDALALLDVNDKHVAEVTASAEKTVADAMAMVEAANLERNEALRRFENSEPSRAVADENAQLLQKISDMEVNAEVVANTAATQIENLRQEISNMIIAKEEVAQKAVAEAEVLNAQIAEINGEKEQMTSKLQDMTDKVNDLSREIANHRMIAATATQEALELRETGTVLGEKIKSLEKDVHDRDLRILNLRASITGDKVPIPTELAEPKTETVVLGTASELGAPVEELAPVV